MVNAIILAILLVAAFLSIRTIVKAKARGQKCIGCPSGGSCPKCRAAKEGKDS
ncbi:MAG: FeoB-associated Cys-rich membrane protein [Treponema sp.]|nr:FeoB-associated Cys-rich membrane protein [Treponema sp.]